MFVSALSEPAAVGHVKHMDLVEKGLSKRMGLILGVLMMVNMGSSGETSTRLCINAVHKGSG